VFPLAKVALEAHPLGDLKVCHDAPLDLLAGFSSGFAPSPVFAAGFGSVLLAPDLFVLPAFSSGDFFVTLSHPDADMRKFGGMLRQDGKLRGSGRNAGLVRLQDADSLALMESLRKPHPGLVRINQAGDGIVGVLGRVNVFSILQEASKDDWRAAAEWLRLGHRAEYWPRAEIAVEGVTKRGEGNIIDAAMLTRLQAAYQQTLESIRQQKPDKQGWFPEQQLT
jgi:hypothetical protein